MKAARRWAALCVGLGFALPVSAQRDSAGVAAGTPSAQPRSPESESQIGEAGKGTIAFRFSYYDNSDSQGDGNPFLDEDLQVLEPVVYFDYNVTNQTQIWAELHYDRVSSASIDRLSNFPQQSGASGDNYIGGDFGFQTKLSSKSTLGAHVGAAFEYDYRSFGLGGHWNRELDANSSFKVAANLYFDQLDIIRFNGDDSEGSDDRTSISLVGSYYRVMSPTMHGEFGASLTSQSGFLETPYNAVVLENPADPPNPNLFNMARGIEFTEELPNDRLRGSLYGRVRKSISESLALELGGRIYADDWGITSFTAEPRALFWLSRDTLRMSTHYRFYTQTEADDYQEHFTGASLPQFRTQDSDLADLDTHTIGVRLDWYTSPESNWEFGVEHTTRSDGLDFLFATFAYTRSF